MNAFGYTPDRRITDFLGNGSFTLSAEIIPPRNGAEQKAILDEIRLLVESGAQFLAVTKGAGGSLRGGSLPIAQSVKERFSIPCIAHFTCRDLTPEEVENQLMDHHYFGIRNILALRGDPPRDSPQWQPREGSYRYAHELIRQIRELNRGGYLKRSGGPQSTDSAATEFCIGAAAYPEHPDPSERIEFFKVKADAGAEYGITQMVFDPEVYARFVDDCGKEGVLIPVLPGTRILRSKGQALRMQKTFGVSVPQWLMDLLPEEPAPLDQTLEIFMKYVDRLRSFGAQGLHLFVLNDATSACEALKRLRSSHKV